LAFAIDDFWRAALLRWTSPFRAARSRSCVALRFAAGVAAGSFASFRAVRSAARCDRLRAVAALVLRMFFFADAILGTDVLSKGKFAAPTSGAVALKPMLGKGLRQGRGAL